MKSHRAPPEGLFIVWKWVESTGVSEIDETSDQENSDDNSDGSSTSNGLAQPPDDEPIEFTLPFKCIGVTRDMAYQVLLKELKDRTDQGEFLKIKLVSEPDNPFDSKAISFQCDHNGKWQTMGYVVREVLSELHDAMANNDIKEVKVAWIKYKLWKRCPGFYAAVNITRKGEWSRVAWQARSTFK